MEFSNRSMLLRLLLVQFARTTQRLISSSFHKHCETLGNLDLTRVLDRLENVRNLIVMFPNGDAMFCLAIVCAAYHTALQTAARDFLELIR